MTYLTMYKLVNARFRMNQGYIKRYIYNLKYTPEQRKKLTLFKFFH
jgi:hypothetical protein